MHRSWWHLAFMEKERQMEKMEVSSWVVALVISSRSCDLRKQGVAWKQIRKKDVNLCSTYLKFNALAKFLFKDNTVFLKSQWAGSVMGFTVDCLAWLLVSGSHGHPWLHLGSTGDHDHNSTSKSKTELSFRKTKLQPIKFNGHMMHRWSQSERVRLSVPSVWTNTPTAFFL